MRLNFRWVEEERPGSEWLHGFEAMWPAYRSWFLDEGDGARPSRSECRAVLGEHMPELLPLWEELVGLAGGDDDVARMLSLVDPPPFLGGCSQAVWRSGAFLVRNYDYKPDACEALVLLTRWHGTSVLASSDCLWGALDGVNEHGLCAALSFGGRRVVGPGFGIPLILRYVLEFCATVDEAAAVLRRVPSHMAYNVSLLDAKGDYAVARVAPDRPTEIVRERATTNHQGDADWKEYVALTRSGERLDFLHERLRRDRSSERFVRRFLEPPLHAVDYERGHGTLYTAVYRPDGRADFLWPHARVSQSLTAFREAELAIRYG